jgi:hypothetical protein
MRKTLCLSVVALAAAVLASIAAAEPGMTIRLGTPDLSSRVSIAVPVIVSCSPVDPSLTLFQEGVSVSVEQASGSAIAHGSGYIEAFDESTLLFPCDDAEHTVLVHVLADPAGPPFHGGPAVFSAFAGTTAGTPCGPSCYYNYVFQGASVGPTTLTMH